MNEIKQTLIDTRAIFSDENKWGKGSLVLFNGCLCLLGGVATASGIAIPSNIDDTESVYDALDTNEAVLHLARTILNGDEVPEDRSALGIVYGFNDDPATEYEHIVTMLDKAIETA